MIFSLAVVSTVGKGYVVAWVMPLCPIYQNVFIHTKEHHNLIFVRYIVVQCFKKLCHYFRHEIRFHLIYVYSIFYHNFLTPDWQISCHLYHFYLFAFRFALCALPNGQHGPRNVVAYRAIIEPYLPARPKMGLNYQKFENLSYEYPAFDT